MVTWLQGRYVMVGSTAKEAAIPVAAGKQREGRGQEQDCSLAAYTPAPGPPPCGTFTRELLHGWVHGPYHHAPRPNHPQTYKAFEGHFSFKLHYNVANFNTHPGNIPPGRLSTITTVGQSSTIIKKWIVVKTQILNFSSKKPYCFQITHIILHRKKILLLPLYQQRSINVITLENVFFSMNITTRNSRSAIRISKEPCYPIW